MKGTFSIQNMNRENEAPVPRMQSLEKAPKRIGNVKKFKGGGWLTSSLYPSLSIMGTEYFSM